MSGVTMVGFGYKTAWLAVRDGEADAVLAELGARTVKSVDWRSGLDRSYVSDDRLVATPPLPGAQDASWLLVVGRRLLLRPELADPVALSERFDTEVQYFASHRVTEYHRWTRAVRGILVRSFAHLGEDDETTEWFGDPDETERAIGLPETAPGEDDTLLVDESDVMRIASAWSVDPTSLDGQPGPGPLRLARV